MTESQLRCDPITGQTVVFAPCRSSRPNAVVRNPASAGSPSETKPKMPGGRPCPFCPGNEERELEVLCWPSCESDAWRVRIVHNKFPAFTLKKSTTNADACCTSTDALHQQRPISGAHDVIVPTPIHDTAAAFLDIHQLASALRVSIEHCKNLASCKDYAYVTLFENHGDRAGSSLPHPHMQVIAPARGTPSPRIEQWREHACAFYKRTGVCSMCQELKNELEDGSRIIYASKHFVAMMPFAAATPFGLRIVPRTHCPDFYHCLTESEDVMEDLATVWKTVLLALRVLHGDPSYNVAFMSPPIDRDAVVKDALHWFAVFDVRVNQPAGFELTTGTYINPKLPEQAAHDLREAIATLK